MTCSHPPTNKHNSIVRPPANVQRLRLRQRSRRPHYAVDLFTAAMVEVATALRKAKRASKWAGRQSA